MGHLHRHIAEWAGMEIDERNTTDEDAQLWVFPKEPGTGVWSHHIQYRTNDGHMYGILTDCSRKQGWQIMTSTARIDNPDVDSIFGHAESPVQTDEKGPYMMEHTVRIVFTDRIKAMGIQDQTQIPMFQGKGHSLGAAGTEALMQVLVYMETPKDKKDDA